MNRSDDSGGGVKRMPLCLSDIDDFEALTARMPTEVERREQGITDEGVPVLVMRRAGREQVYRADLITVTVDTSPVPDPGEVIDATRRMLEYAVEALGNVQYDLGELAEIITTSPGRAPKLAAEWQRRRLADT